MAQRTRLQFTVTQDRDGFVVHRAESPLDFPPALEFWRGKHVAVLPLGDRDTRFSPEALAYERRRKPHLPHAVRIDPPHGLKNRVRRYLDWEKVTPVDEISASSIRGWLKRTLRRVRK